jgi:pimeloyl-ACP methyl ester carboxylesterase
LSQVPGNGPVTPHAARRSFCDSRDWRRQLDAFAAEFTVIAWDAPGCGESADLPSSDCGLDNLIDTLAGFIRALRLQRPHVLGLSLGSILAIALQAGHPGVVRSLVLASAYAGPGGPGRYRRRRCNAGSG